MTPLWLLLTKVLTFLLPEGGAKDGIAQIISDYVTIDVSGMLSERLTAQYMYDHMGGLEGPEEGDMERLASVEAYNVNIPLENNRIVVDRRSIYQEEGMDYEQYQEQGIEAMDKQLIEEAVQSWFENLIVSTTRVSGSDPNRSVGNMVRDSIKFRFGIGATLKYGILHTCFEFPSLYTSPTSSSKTMYVELYGRLLGDPESLTGSPNPPPRPRARSYPYVHIWKVEELQFELLAITYSDQRYLSVHMPGYG